MCFAALQRIGSMLSHMGIQIASRKRRDTGEKTGAWAGTVVHTSDQELQLFVSQEKWDKTKEKIYRLKEDVDSGNLLDFKDLESIRGFLIYVSRTYTSMIPYLKGLHQTISGWLPGRDIDGWKLSPQELEMELLRRETSPTPAIDPHKDAPATVPAKPRLKQDMEVLERLTSPAAPPKRRARVSKLGTV